MSLWKFLGLGDGPGEGAGGRAAQAGDTRSVRRIVSKLESMEPERARYVAAFAYILGRVAYADREISDAETATMERLVADVGGLSEDLAVLVVQIAKSQNLLIGGTEDYLVTREFQRLASDDQKRDLVRCLLAVAAADDVIAVVEENEIARIANELRLTHDVLVELKLPYADKLETLRHGRG